jgi:uncharacterized lipoprotein YddW (UPF0748 family)
MMDVVRRYDIDGLHIDDYFYPYPSGKTPFPDSAAHKKYGPGQSVAAWRRQNVDRFVKRLYDSIKAEKKWVKFGISPFGIYRPNVPQGIEAGLDQYAQLYADARKWLNQGWCDYFTPQLYWSLDSKGQPYGKLLRWWVGENDKGRHIWPGLAAYKMVEGPKWQAMELADQVSATRRTDGATGHVFFSAKYIVNNTGGLADALRASYPDPALVPASLWVDSKAPEIPGGAALASRGTNGDDDLRWVAISELRDGRWQCVDIRHIDEAQELHMSRNTQAMAIHWIDRAGNASKPRVITPAR